MLEIYIVILFGVFNSRKSSLSQRFSFNLFNPWEWNVFEVFPLAVEMSVDKEGKRNDQLEIIN
jgi:hypothetical protein